MSDLPKRYPKTGPAPWHGQLDLDCIGEQVMRFMENETVEEKPEPTHRHKARSKCKYCGSELNITVDTCGFCEAKQ